MNVRQFCVSGFGLILLGVPLGCGVDHYHAETRLYPDGSVERTIIQPGDSDERIAMLGQGWRSVQGVELDESTFEVRHVPVDAPREAAEADSDRCEVCEEHEECGECASSQSDPDYLLATGVFESAEQIPLHFEQKTPDGNKSGRLIPKSKSRDLVFVIEHRWDETLTDVVELHDLQQACRELAEVFINLNVPVLQEAYGNEYETEKLASWLRTDGTLWLREAAEAMYEVSVQRQIHRRVEQWANSELENRMQKLSARHGLHELSEAAIERFADAKLRDLFRKKDGSPPDEQVVEDILRWWNLRTHEEKNEDNDETPGEKRLQEIQKQKVLEKFGSDEARAEKMGELLSRILGVYGLPLTTPLKFRYTLTMPGSIAETNGRLLSDGTVRWEFDAWDAYPLGYAMWARSLVVVSELQSKRLQGNPLADRSKLLDYVSIVSHDEELLDRLRDFAETGNLETLNKYRDSLTGTQDAHRRHRVVRLWKLLNLAE